ncbi:hypothetical protein EX30DRAFT_20810 [Ascodesmis nigricans]|uniref:Uncharacterized protein n=1 Tax=Ascodesmis nigricans TaxID=341454 RepID=A0A4S2N808_9PEZI|nr:hypothetical protein EX30DRAFT_20810 [Ascodesmis nigricans]
MMVTSITNYFFHHLAPSISFPRHESPPPPPFPNPTTSASQASAQPHYPKCQQPHQPSKKSPSLHPSSPTHATKNSRYPRALCLKCLHPNRD